MSVAFGFSAGDFLAAISLVGTVIDSLRASSSARVAYHELLSQLLSLETALIQIKRLEVEDVQYAEVIALRQAAAQCRRTIDAFLVKIEGYRGALGKCVDVGGTKERVRSAWMRVRWSVCRTEDVEGFKRDLGAHTESLGLLLMAVQM
jgi:hypothetical protein